MSESSLARRVLVAILLLGTMRAQTSGPVTHIEVTDTVLRDGVRRMGINLGEQTYYDSGQMLKNLVWRNPGFEGMEYRSIVRCAQAGAVCVTEDGAEAWPNGFWDGAQCEWLAGPSATSACSVVSSAKAGKMQHIALHMDPSAGPPHGSYLVMRKRFLGDPTEGWWPETAHGGQLSAETEDLSPSSHGKQALRMSAEGAGQTAAVMSYFDSTQGHSFLRLHGRYRLRLRAKGVGGTKTLRISVNRQSQPEEAFLTRTVPLSGEWEDLNYEFAANDAAAAIGPVRLRLEAVGSSVLVDDVALDQMDGDPTNKTAFRDEVVAALKDLHPGVLRYMGSSTELGSSIGNLLSPPDVRLRSGYSVWKAKAEDVPIGLAEFLELCQEVKAEPWVVFPATDSADGMRTLITYLSLWSQRLPMIHIEIGNEVWNSLYRGASIEDVQAYGARAAALFTAARGARGFSAQHFDLIVGGQVVAAERNRQMLDASGGYDGLAIAPYLMHWVKDDSSVERMFGALLAEPEMMESSGVVRQEREAADRAKQPAGLDVYEVNLHTTEGRISQAALDRLTPSMGAGLAVADHMLLMLREDDVRTQALFSLGGFENKRADGKHVLLWGSVVDMGGATNRRRPQFLAEELINQSMLRTMVRVQQSGADPSWSQAKGNDDVALSRAHLIQSFGFQDGPDRSLILLNLSRTAALPVDFGGQHPPRGNVEVRTLGAAQITDNNESSEQVKIASHIAEGFDPSKWFSLPPFSMTVLRWRSQ